MILFVCKVFGALALVIGLTYIFVCLLFWGFDYDEVLPNMDDEAD